MYARLGRILAVILCAGCLTAPAAFASGRSGAQDQVRANADTALHMLESIQSIKVGAKSTVVTIRSGRKAHPIVIDYGEALQTGVAGAADGNASSDADGGGVTLADRVPKGLTLGQVGALLVGLTVVSRVIRIVRQVVPIRSR